MKRTPLKRKTPLARGTVPLRRSRLAPVSDKRQAENTEYDRLRVVFLAFNPECKPCQDAERQFGSQDIAPPECPPVFITRKVQPSTQVHHMGRRHGKWLLDTRFFLPCCQYHHDLIERHGDWARSRGYLLTPEQRRLLQPTTP